MTAPGIHAILYAFFDTEERLDRAVMRRQVEACLEAGVAGIAALGLATEVAKLGFDERRRRARPSPAWTWWPGMPRRWGLSAVKRRADPSL